MRSTSNPFGGPRETDMVANRDVRMVVQTKLKFDTLTLKFKNTTIR